MSFAIDETTDNEKFKLYGTLHLVPQSERKSVSDYVYMYKVNDETVYYNPVNNMIRISKKYKGIVVFSYLTIKEFKAMVNAHAILYSNINIAQNESKLGVKCMYRRFNIKWGKLSIGRFNDVKERYIHALETLMNKHEVIPSEYQVEKEAIKESES